MSALVIGWLAGCGGLVLGTCAGFVVHALIGPKPGDEGPSEATEQALDEAWADGYEAGQEDAELAPELAVLVAADRSRTLN